MFCVRVNRKRLPRGYMRLRQLATAAGVPVYEVNEREIAERAKGRSHAGVVAEVGERRAVELADLGNVPEPGMVAMLDGIEDPYNFGSAIRSLYLAGATGLVLGPRDWTSALTVVTRASAGASELLPAAKVKTAAEAAEYFEALGWTILLLEPKGEQSLFQVDLTQPAFLIIGGEHRGAHRQLSDREITRVSIPYGRSSPISLGAAATAAVVGFEVARQRGVVHRPV